MKKVGIVTLNGNFNYGNRLQNYALKKYLEKLGVDVSTIWFMSSKQKVVFNLKKIVFRILKYKKKNNFLAFSKLLNIKYYTNRDISSNYDYFIVGSDQVWNYNFPDFNSDMFLSFSPVEKNISYAASFGVSEISDEYNDIFLNGLTNFKNISVREDVGAKIIYELLGIRVKVLLDPTMLLDRNEWGLLASKPSIFPNGKYIFTYFLGTISKAAMEAINILASERGLEVVDVLNKKSKYFDCGPCEFLYLIQNSEYVCTDSFHASVFSIIFDKSFIVFDRDLENNGDMSSRLDTLLDKLHLNNRRFNGINITRENIIHNYTNAYKIIEKMKEDSREYLINSMDIR